MSEFSESLEPGYIRAYTKEEFDKGVNSILKRFPDMPKVEAEARMIILFKEIEQEVERRKMSP